ncbi:hypothetical protein L2E82_00921 [Cichorium intybus]|uniref:Uncharacterized protein n=1 Tax=Cichorium intybus TaxID=13427 RepID=A0ACB9GXY9_CICIN|nr:hypothetical protein L2E82_00921 [Cichorium intybus]
MPQIRSPAQSICFSLKSIWFACVSQNVPPSILPSSPSPTSPIQSTAIEPPKTKTVDSSRKRIWRLKESPPPPLQTRLAVSSLEKSKQFVDRATQADNRNGIGRGQEG